jgi:O-antigen/teichoic acid export membrane protein
MNDNPAMGWATGRGRSDESPGGAPPDRPLTGGAAMVGLSRGAVAVTGAATTIVVAHLLGPTGAGSYAIAQTVIILLTVATTLGAEHGIVFYVSSGRWAVRRAFYCSQRLALVSGLVGVGVAVIARLLVPHAFRGLSVPLTLAAAAALPFALAWLYASYVALATARYEQYVLPPALQSALALALVASFGAIDGVRGAVLGFTIAHVLTALGLRFAACRAVSRQPGVAEMPAPEPALRRAVTFGIKGYAANALQVVNYRLDLFILSATATGAAVGRYSLAVAVTSVLWLLPSALSDVLFPRVASLSARSGRNDRQLLELVEAKTLRHTVLATLVAVGVTALALLTLVVPVYGSAFRPTTSLGLILLPGVALLGFCATFAATIVGRGRPGLMLAATVVVTPPTVGLYAVLIPSLHATGAALASSISYAAMFALTAVLFRRVTGINPLRRMVPTSSEIADYINLGRAIGGRWGLLRVRLASGRSRRDRCCEPRTATESTASEP